MAIKIIISNKISSYGNVVLFSSLFSFLLFFLLPSTYTSLVTLSVIQIQLKDVRKFQIFRECFVLIVLLKKRS